MCGAGEGSELPTLELASGGAQQKTDARGRAYFGDVRIAEGSGRVGSADENAGGNACPSGAVELTLVAQVAGLGDADARWALTLQALR